MRNAVLFLFALIIHSTFLFGQASSNTIRTVSGRKISVNDLDTFIKRTMDSLKMPGLSIAIINKASLVYHRALGVTNNQTDEPVTKQTIFEAASLSKPMFAYFALKQIEQGVIELDKPLYTYLPHPGIKDNDERYKLITARMVLSHTTGFPNWSHGKPVELLFTPGTDFSYSGEAYQYLAAVLAVTQNTNWQAGLDSIFQVHVAKPLALKNSWYTWNNYIADHKATGHKQNEITTDDKPSKSFGAGYSLHTESVDYATFLIALMKKKGLATETFSEMFREQIKFKAESELSKTGQTGWCLGFSMKPTPYGMRYLHTGNNHDFQSYACMNVDKQYGLVFFTNSDKAFEFIQVLGDYLDDSF